MALPGKNVEYGLDNCDLAFHLDCAGWLKNEHEYEIGNLGSLERILTGLELRTKRPLIVPSSPI